MTTTQPERKALHAYLSPEAHEAWHDFAAENGVSVSGLIEVLPELFGSATQSDRKITDKLVKSARKVDSARRRRG